MPKLPAVGASADMLIHSPSLRCDNVATPAELPSARTKFAKATSETATTLGVWTGAQLAMIGIVARMNILRMIGLREFEFDCWITEITPKGSPFYAQSAEEIPWA